MECFDSDVLPDLVARAAVNYGDSMIAFYTDTDKISYQELHDKSICIAAALEKHDSYQGQKIVLYMERSIEFVVTLFAIHRVFVLSTA